MSLCDVILYIIKKSNEYERVVNLKRIKAVLYLLQKKGYIDLNISMRPTIFGINTVDPKRQLDIYMTKVNRYQYVDPVLEALDKLIIEGKVKVRIMTTYDPKTGLKNLRVPTYYTDEEVKLQLDPEAEEILKWSTLEVYNEIYKKIIDVKVKS
jgi:hypothetical protein